MEAIKAVLESWQQAVVAEDLEKIMSHYTEDIIAYDAIKALQFKGKKNYGDHWKECLSYCPGGILFEFHDLAIQAEGPLAVCHYLCKCGSVQDFGSEKASWMRATVCLRQHNGEWKISHEHFSAPFDPESGKAIFDEHPDGEQTREVKPGLQSMCAYLSFDGNCEEALRLYTELLGGAIDMMIPFEGSPAEEHVPENWRKKIMHAQASLGSWTLMACDSPPGMYARPQGNHLQVSVNSAEEAERIYSALSRDGIIEMKMERTFWAERFGMLIDRFGTPWMINFEGDAQGAHPAG